MKRLLVVPFTYTDRFRVRSLEFASRWIGRFHVFVLRWHWLSDVRASNLFTRRLRQTLSALGDLVRITRVSVGESGFQVVDRSFLHPALVQPFLGQERALRLARRYNGFQLERLLRRLCVDRLLIANTWFNVPQSRDVALYYDVGDWFNEENLAQDYFAREKAWFRDSLSFTSGNFAVSLPLVRKLTEELTIPTHYLPNGVDIQSVRGVEKTAVARLREGLSLEGRWVLGYIGNHDDHAGLDFLLEVLVALQRRVSDAALLVVGPYHRWKRRLQVPDNVTIRLTGSVPPRDVPLYCQLQDIAVHPCDKSQFRDYAFPLKVIEATAARKFVVSTDLLTLRQLEFPNVHLLARDVQQWVDTLHSLRGRSWQPEWDSRVEPYDWQRLADKAADWME
jgi:glycosyltransferase involved in cell wall biosynthesis